MHNLFATVAILASFSLAASTGAGQPVRPKPLDLTPEDIAAALDLRWWKHRLEFGKPIMAVDVNLCELKRRKDGSWQKSRLAPGVGYGSADKGFKEVTVAVFFL